eukprot:1075061-Pleurochrysis_carterae.AAC.16
MARPGSRPKRALMLSPCCGAQVLDLWWYPLSRDSAFYALSIILMVLAMADGQAHAPRRLALTTSTRTQAHARTRTHTHAHARTHTHVSTRTRTRAHAHPLPSLDMNRPRAPCAFPNLSSVPQRSVGSMQLLQSRLACTRTRSHTQHPLASANPLALAFVLAIARTNVAPTPAPRRRAHSACPLALCLSLGLQVTVFESASLVATYVLYVSAMCFNEKIVDWLKRCRGSALLYAVRGATRTAHASPARTSRAHRADPLLQRVHRARAR